MAGGDNGAGYSPWDVPEGSGGYGGASQPGPGGHLPAFGAPPQQPMTSFPGVQTQPNPAAGWPQAPAPGPQQNPAFGWQQAPEPQPSQYLSGPADSLSADDTGKRRKTLLISGAAALAVVGIAGTIVLSGGGSDSKQQPTAAATTHDGVTSSAATPGSQTETTSTDRNGQPVAASASSSSAPLPPPVAAPTADVLHWRLAEPKGGTTAADSSGHARSGTASGAVTFGPQHGGSVFFNGKAGEIKAGEVATSAPAVNTAKSFTVSMWVDQTGLTTPTQFAAAFSQDGAQCFAFTLSYSVQQKAWIFTRAESDVRDPVTVNAVSTSPTPLNTWIQLTGVYDAPAGTITLYVDGVPQSTVHTAAAPYAARGPFAIGRSWYQQYPSNPFNGYISDVRVYDRALTAAEIAKI